jgi:hypothetical protein
MAVLLGVPGLVYNTRSNRTQAAEIVPVLRAQAKPGDLVVYCPDQLGPAFSRHLPGDIAAVTYPAFGRPGRVDWVDYATRNERADPQAFAQEALRRSRQTIWLVTESGYRTFGDQCERLTEILDAARPGSSVVVAEDGSRFFEHANLIKYPPRA